jgi:hypothetical protein
LAIEAPFQLGDAEAAFFFGAGAAAAQITRIAAKATIAVMMIDLRVMIDCSFDGYGNGWREAIVPEVITRGSRKLHDSTISPSPLQEAAFPAVFAYAHGRAMSVRHSGRGER